MRGGSDNLSPNGSATGSASTRPRLVAPSGGGMFDDVPQSLRTRMRQVALEAPDSRSALVDVIDLVVGGDERKRAAIVTAISGNTALHDQWITTFETLRG